MPPGNLHREVSTTTKKGIRLGPSLPAFITPNVLQVLVDTFDIKPIATPDADL